MGCLEQSIDQTFCRSCPHKVLNLKVPGTMLLQLWPDVSWRFWMTTRAKSLNKLLSRNLLYLTYVANIWQFLLDMSLVWGVIMQRDNYKTFYSPWSRIAIVVMKIVQRISCEKIEALCCLVILLCTERSKISFALFSGLVQGRRSCKSIEEMGRGCASLLRGLYTQSKRW